MADTFVLKGQWMTSDDGVNYRVRAIETRSRRILAKITVNVPMETELDFIKAFGRKAKTDIENAAKEIARNVAAGTEVRATPQKIRSRKIVRRQSNWDVNPLRRSL